MTDSTLKKYILNQLELLGSREQEKVLDFAKALVERKPFGKPGKSLLRFPGVIDKADLNFMEETINEGCGHFNKIDDACVKNW
ncbi:MAG: hypothetical protein ACYC9O_16390 [Candidatus Latescibacterota bacterium]